MLWYTVQVVVLERDRRPRRLRPPSVLSQRQPRHLDLLDFEADQQLDGKLERMGSVWLKYQRMLGKGHANEYQRMRYALHAVRMGGRSLSLGLALIFVVGCGGRGSTESVFVSPLDEVMGFDPILGLMHREELYTAMGDCFEAAGFVVPDIREFHKEFRVNLDGPEHLDEVYRTVYPGPGRYGRVSSPLDDYIDSLPPSQVEAFQRVAYGDGSMTGCVPAAQLEVYGTTDSAAAENVIIEILARVAADERTLEASAAWSKCMSTRGYDFDTPDAARSYLAGVAAKLLALKNSGVDLASERAALEAVEDELELESNYNECAEEVGRPSIVRQVLLDVEQTYVEEHPNLREVIAAP